MKNALARVQKKISGEVGLEDRIAELLNYGTPSIFCHAPERWTATLDLNTDRVIVSAKVRAEGGSIGECVLHLLDQCRSLDK